MVKVYEAYYNEDVGILQVVPESGIVEHIYPTEEHEKYNMGIYARSQVEKLLNTNPVEYEELVLNGELERYVELCNAEGRHLREDLGLSREFMMYDS